MEAPENRKTGTPKAESTPPMGVSKPGPSAILTRPEDYDDRVFRSHHTGLKGLSGYMGLAACSLSN